MHWQLLNLKNHSASDGVTYPGLLGPDGLKFPGLMRFPVSGFISSGLCGPTEDMDILLLSRLSPVTNEFFILLENTIALLLSREIGKFFSFFCRKVEDIFKKVNKF